MKQRILTPGVGGILQLLLDEKNAGNRIVSVCPHYRTEVKPDAPVSDQLYGYIVVVEDAQ